MRDVEAISADVVDVALRLHRELGPGLLESVYELILAHRLSERGYVVDQQKPIDIEFDGIKIPNAFRVDLFIDECFVVEIKSVERLNPAHLKQLLTYLRLTKQPIGLLINFGAPTLKDGLRRVINEYVPFASSRLRVNQNRGG